jgi:hypothetical protein
MMRNAACSDRIQQFFCYSMVETFFSREFILDVATYTLARMMRAISA